MNMVFTKEKIIRIALMSAFLLCMLFANFYAVRKMGRYGTELFVYDKLLVAYNIAGQVGMEEELEKILVDEKFPRQVALAREFKASLKNLKEPGAYLNEKVAQHEKNIMLLRNLRTAAIILMVIIFGWQLLNKLRKAA